MTFSWRQYHSVPHHLKSYCFWRSWFDFPLGQRIYSLHNLYFGICCSSQFNLVYSRGTSLICETLPVSMRSSGFSLAELSLFVLWRSVVLWKQASVKSWKTFNMLHNLFQYKFFEYPVDLKMQKILKKCRKNHIHPNVTYDSFLSYHM